MATAKIMLLRRTFQDQLWLSSRFYCRHTCSLTGVVEWGKDVLDVRTRRKIEEHWRSEITKYKFNKNDPNSKMYVLAMFPYPSGSLHMGHVRVYTISDTLARYYRLQGKNVFHPMGWDSFGLPAENAARDHKVDPRKWTETNISQMREQLKSLGFNFDWECEVSTCDPKYYQWTQWLFLKLYHAGLVYKKEALVNWDPVDQTVLADEQVDANNCSWRSGAKVEKKLLRQWFIRSTRFSESLLAGLQDLRKEDWQDIIKLQSAWIGKVEGTRVDCEIDCDGKGNGLNLSVWLPRPEDLPKASFIAVPKGSVLDILESDKATEDFTVPSHNTDGTDLHFTVRRLSARLCHPLTGEKLPMFVVDGLLRFDQGADTYLGVPETSLVDRQFSKLISADVPSKPIKNAMSGENVRSAVCAELRKRGIGGWPASSSLRDWLISRQRYWGTPIPMVNCDACNDTIPIPFEDLPVILPDSNPGDVVGSAALSPLHLAKNWLHTKCPKCGGKATRETDTMDTFVDSSWYYARYLDHANTEAPFRTDVAKNFMPVDLYVGGKEHANLHLYYARFMGHFLHSQGYLPQKEPFRRFLPQGMVMGRCYTHPESGKFLKHDEIDFSGPHPIDRATGDKVSVSWEKMSKSKHNGVSPVNVVEDYGVDTTRLIMLADAIPQSQKNWCPETTGGVYRWQNRLFSVVTGLLHLRLEQGRKDEHQKSAPFIEDDKQFWEIRNKCVSVVNFNYDDTMQLSVAVSAMQTCTKSLQNASPEIKAQSVQYERALASLLILLSPMAPHFASELWQGVASAPFVLTRSFEEFDWDMPVLDQRCPDVDQDYPLELIISVNADQISSIRIPRKKLDTLHREEAQELVLQSSDVRNIISDNEIKKVSFHVTPGYRGKIDLSIPNFKVPPKSIIAKTRAAKKKVYVANKQKKKS